MISATCPFCESDKKVKQVAGSFFLCSNCSLVFNETHTPLVYNDSYFLDDYKKQYGKTYVDDFKNIYSISSSRLKKIISVSGLKNLKQLSLLDIGSAAGFFLKCARDNGFGAVEGVEISDYASSYCKKEFGINVYNKSFLEINFIQKYDVITAWYFIEHVYDFKGILIKIYDMLEDGGIFAFSIPSYYGPLFRFNPDRWISTHPVDHRIDLSPEGAIKILKEIGYEKVVVRGSGFHPERVLNKNNVLFRPFSFFYRIFTMITGFSDTIEIFSVKPK